MINEINNNVINYQLDLLQKFTKKYKLMLENIQNNKLSNEKIDFLRKFNNDLQVTMDEFDILNDVLSSNDELDHNMKLKLKKYNNMNKTIEKFLQYILVNTMFQQI